MEAVLHERRGGWADAMQTVRHLAGGRAPRAPRSARRWRSPASSPAWCIPAEGDVECETVVACPGPWVEPLWALLGLDPIVEMDGERRPLVTYIKAQEGEFALEGAGLSGVGGRGGAGGAPRPGRPAPLGPRRERARGRALGHLLPHGPHRHRHHGRRPPGVPGPDRRSTPTARTIPSTRPSRSSRTSSCRAWPRRCGASADARATGA